jgi:acetyltransferase-like isoleucine patch superfamily enzyme
MYNYIRYAHLLMFGRLYCGMKGVKFGNNLLTFGIPMIHRNPSAEIVLGDNVVLTSLPEVNLVGAKNKVVLSAPRKESKIHIGNNSGMNCAVIYAAEKVSIGNYVNIGANVAIYDTDFHQLDYLERRKGGTEGVLTKPVVIEDDAWIGTNAVILKGVTVGRGAIIGAGSVVANDIPPFTIWWGNPARYLKEIKR